MVWQLSVLQHWVPAAAVGWVFVYQQLPQAGAICAWVPAAAAAAAAGYCKALQEMARLQQQGWAQELLMLVVVGREQRMALLLLLLLLMEVQLAVHWPTL